MRSLFVVGDGKQSIFSFQGAKPLEFDRMQSSLRKRIGENGGEFRNISLDLSFRSTAAVLQAVDDVFALPEARDGLIFSEGDISHQAYRQGMAGRVELLPLAEVKNEDNGSAWQNEKSTTKSQTPETLSANYIADMIANWLKSGRKIISQDRQVQAGDIMILVQRRGRFASEMLRSLKRRNIPVAGSDRMILTNHIAVQDCMVLGEFLLLPQDDLSLATLLKSPFCGLDDDDLFELAYNRKHETIWQSLKHNPKFAQTYEFLSDILGKTDYLSPYQLFAYILEVKGGRKKLAARLGSEIEDPLNEFLALALEYSQSNPPSLQGFLRRLQIGSGEVKRDLEKAKNEVRIMTVHGSKGLQAPIVFIADANAIPKPDGGILWTQDNIPLRTISGIEENNCNILKAERKLEQEREHRRLLYVAMTRAEDELYITGRKGEKEISDKSWYELIKKVASEKWQKIDDTYILSCEQTIAASKPKNPSKESAIVDFKMPDWINAAAPAEPLPSKPLSPSKLEKDLDANYFESEQKLRLKGIFVHKLLQYIPDVNISDRQAAIARIAKNYSNDFTSEEISQMSEQVLNILQNDDFSHVFGKDSLAEVPISGIIEDASGNPLVIAGQIDRIAVTSDKVYIIDYKTSTKVPSESKKVGRNIIKQMAAYKKAVEQIYPQKQVLCALLWTAECKIMQLDL